MTTIHGYSPSGNCHKLRLLLERLGRPYRWIGTDRSRGATRTPGYLAKNPNGKVPMLEPDDGRVLVAGPRYGIADIALFPYTDAAGDGGFDLSPYPALRDRLARVRATPRFVAMPAPAPENAALIAASR
ncbi:glutathione S-transferase N-terminal domain-containing protein [Luteimonas huabeiensis]|uniref:glutathione S-transferase N-terminal domain-containing protein n=1 Tax=Luteimonas huabeiensis TaxID=1244513 RepID=UPI000466AEA6|nr:glutathione S-transferase N-terminal domain-containing protein [Luteimonas huabeiensis]